MTATNKNIGVLVACYYALYICLECSSWGVTMDVATSSFEVTSEWYFACFLLTILIMVASIFLFINGDNVAGFYALCLFIPMTFDGVSSVFQLTEENGLLIVYNGVQNLSILLDLFVVFIGMDHIIKRKHNGTSAFIDYIDYKLDDWRGMAILLCGKGEKCLKKI